MKGTVGSSIFFNAPKAIVQGSAAGVVGAGTYGASKGIGKLVKILRKVASDEEYQAAFVKIAKKLR